MSTIGSLQVNITASTGGITKGLQSAQRMLGGFVNKASLVGAAVTAAFGAMLKSFESNGSQLEELSKATGIAVDELAFLKYAAVQSGSGIEALTKASRELQTKGIDPSRFESIAASIASIEDPTQRAQSAFFYFGKKAGSAILPMLTALPKLKERFEQLGGGFTDKMATAAKALGNSWGNVKLVLENVTDHIAFALAPTITKLSEFIADNGKAITEWIDNNRMLLVAVGATAVALTAVAPILYTISTAINVVSTSLAALQVVAALASKNPLIMALTLGTLAAVGTYQYLKPAPFANNPAGAMPTSTPGKMPSGPGGASSVHAEVAANTAATNDTMQLLLVEMRRQNQKREDEQGPPATQFTLAPAGVR